MTSLVGVTMPRVPPWAVLVGLAAVVPLVHPSAWAHRSGVQLLILVLVGLSLTVTVGWLRVVTLFQPAAVGAGAAVTAGMLATGRPFAVGLVAASAAGAAVGLAALVPALSDPPRWLPATSLVMTAAGSLVVPRYAFRPFPPPDLLGADLGDDRVLYLAGLIVVVAACLLVARVQRADLGRRLLAVGVDPGLAERSGFAAGAAWRDGLLLSGALAGGAGCLTAVLYQGLPNPLEFSPTAAVAYLAIPLVGGAWLVGGALAGALAFLLAARVSLWLGLASLAVPAALIVAALAARRPDGLAGWAIRADGLVRRRGPW